MTRLDINITPSGTYAFYMIRRVLGEKNIHSGKRFSTIVLNKIDTYTFRSFKTLLSLHLWATGVHKLIALCLIIYTVFNRDIGRYLYYL